MDKQWEIKGLDLRAPNQKNLLSRGFGGYCSFLGRPRLRPEDVEAIIRDMRMTPPWSICMQGGQLMFLFWWNASGYPTAHTEEDLRRLLNREIG